MTGYRPRRQEALSGMMVLTFSTLVNDRPVGGMNWIRKN